VPYLGHVSHLLTPGERQLAVYLLATSLLAYAVVLLASGRRERRRTPITTKGRHV
jgi:hypothetical protein